MAQSAHAVANFSYTHHELFKTWHKESNYIVCLSTESESELSILMERLESNNASHVGFREPDMDNQLTAIAAYGDDVQNIFSNLPLALKEYGRQKLTSKDKNDSVAQLAEPRTLNPPVVGSNPTRVSNINNKN